MLPPVLLPMLLLIDHYDSFVQTLARYCRELGVETRTVRFDRVGPDDLAAATALLLSPGPCGPAEAAATVTIVRQTDRPMLGVCLGHQIIVAAFGGRVVAGPHPTHGRASLVRHDGSDLFTGVPDRFPVARYHSLHAVRLPDDLTVTAELIDDSIALPETTTPKTTDPQTTARETADPETAAPVRVMAVAHRSRPVYGVQFHPESVLTPDGRRVLFNFLKLAGFDGLVPPSDWGVEAARRGRPSSPPFDGSQRPAWFAAGEIGDDDPAYRLP